VITTELTESTERSEMINEELTEKVIGALIEVHKHTGPGLLESKYQHCLYHELKLRGLHYDHEVKLPVIYKGVRIECGYRLDVVVEDLVLIELKSVDKIIPIHEAQLLTHMKLGGYRVGLLANFNVKLMIDGITRRVL
jgi:GxxExxY protein